MFLALFQQEELGYHVSPLRLFGTPAKLALPREVVLPLRKTPNLDLIARKDGLLLWSSFVFQRGE